MCKKCCQVFYDRFAVFYRRCYAERGYATVSRPSVRPSVCLWRSSMFFSHSLSCGMPHCHLRFMFPTFTKFLAQLTLVCGCLILQQWFWSGDRASQRPINSNMLNIYNFFGAPRPHAHRVSSRAPISGRPKARTRGKPLINIAWISCVHCRISIGLLGWVTVCGRVNHLSMCPVSHLGQLSLPSLGGR